MSDTADVVVWLTRCAPKVVTTSRELAADAAATGIVVADASTTRSNNETPEAAVASEDVSAVDSNAVVARPDFSSVSASPPSSNNLVQPTAEPASNHGASGVIDDTDFPATTVVAAESPLSSSDATPVVRASLPVNNLATSPLSVNVTENTGARQTSHDGHDRVVQSPPSAIYDSGSAPLPAASTGPDSGAPSFLGTPNRINIRVPPPMAAPSPLHTALLQQQLQQAHGAHIAYYSPFLNALPPSPVHNGFALPIRSPVHATATSASPPANVSLVSSSPSGRILSPLLMAVMQQTALVEAQLSALTAAQAAAVEAAGHATTAANAHSRHATAALAAAVAAAAGSPRVASPYLPLRQSSTPLAPFALPAPALHEGGGEGSPARDVARRAGDAATDTHGAQASLSRGSIGGAVSSPVARKTSHAGASPVSSNTLRSRHAAVPTPTPLTAAVSAPDAGVEYGSGIMTSSDSGGGGHVHDNTSSVDDDSVVTENDADDSDAHAYEGNAARQHLLPQRVATPAAARDPRISVIRRRRLEAVQRNRAVAAAAAAVGDEAAARPAVDARPADAVLDEARGDAPERDDAAAPDAVAAAAAPRGIWRFIDIALLFRLSLLAAVFLQGGGLSETRMVAVAAMLVAVYVVRVGLAAGLLDVLQSLCTRRLQAVPGEAGAAAANAVAPQPLPRDLVAGLTAIALAWPGHILYDMLALVASFLVSAVPTWTPSEQLPALAQQAAAVAPPAEQPAPPAGAGVADGPPPQAGEAQPA